MYTLFFQKYPRLTVFSGAISALALMTVLSAVFGTVFIQFIPPNITRWISVLLFVIFGIKMLFEGYKMTASDAHEEMEEVQHDIRKREEEVSLPKNNQNCQILLKNFHSMLIDIIQLFSRE